MGKRQQPSKKDNKKSKGHDAPSKKVVEEEPVVEEVESEEEEEEITTNNSNAQSPAAPIEKKPKKTKMEKREEREREEEERRRAKEAALDDYIKSYVEAIKVDEYLFSLNYGSNFFIAGVAVSLIPLYIFFTPIYNLPLIPYAPVVGSFALASAFLLNKAFLGAAVKAERDILKSRNIRLKKPANGESEPPKTSAAGIAGSEAIYWSLFINNTVFLLLSLMLSILILPAAIGFAFEGETTDENGVVTATTVEDALSVSTLEKIYVVAAAFSVLAPSFIISRGVTII